MLEIERRNLPENWRTGQSRRIYWIATRGVAIGILVTGFHFLLPILINSLTFVNQYSNPSNRLQATAIFASSLLTFALIAVYRDIGETQARQLQIQENQENLMELQYKPRIRTHHLRIGSKARSIRVAIRNYGNGLAEDIYMRTDIMLPDQGGGYPSDISTFSGDGTIEIQDSTGGKSYTVEGGASDLTRPDIEEMAISIDYSGGHLPPEDGEIVFETSPLIRYQSDEDGSIKGEPIVKFLKKIDSAGYNQVIIIFSIVYEDVNDNKYVEYAFGTFFHIDLGDDESISMSDILDSTPPTYTPNMEDILNQVRSSWELYPS